MTGSLLGPSGASEASDSSDAGLAVDVSRRSTTGDSAGLIEIMGLRNKSRPRKNWHEMYFKSLAIIRQSYEEIYLFSFSPRVHGNPLGGCCRNVRDRSGTLLRVIQSYSFGGRIRYGRFTGGIFPALPLRPELTPKLTLIGLS